MIFFLGRALTTAHWGKLSDRIGRKLSILIILTLWSINLFFYSFVNNFFLAMLGRFIFGALSGLSPICKCTLTEILPKD